MVLGLSLLLDWLKVPVLQREEMMMGKMWELVRSSECPKPGPVCWTSPAPPCNTGEENLN